MDVDGTNTAAYLATAAVTYAGTLLTAWATFFRTLKGNVDSAKKQATSQEDFDAHKRETAGTHKEIHDKNAELERRLSIAETKIKAFEKREAETNGRIERIQDRMSKLATDEELTTLSNRQSDQYNGLTERLGRVIGALEQWGRP